MLFNDAARRQASAWRNKDPWYNQVQHYASLEGEQLQLYRTISIIGLLLAAVILVEKISTFMYKEFRKPGPDGKLYITPEGWSNLSGFCVDLILQVHVAGDGQSDWPVMIAIGTSIVCT
jgi:hypothetical protein